MLQACALALRTLASLPAADEGEARDLLAFLHLALSEVQESVEATAAAWEKRDYWLKADRFRAEWRWAGAIARRLDQALRSADLGAGMAVAAELASPLSSVAIPARLTGSRPWEGAWRRWADS